VPRNGVGVGEVVLVVDEVVVDEVVVELDVVVVPLRMESGDVASRNVVVPSTSWRTRTTHPPQSLAPMSGAVMEPERSAPSKRPPAGSLQS
jgi:hypothetical protein